MIRVAVVGAGYFGQFHYDAWSRIEDCSLVGLCTRSGAGAAETAEKYGVQKTYTDLAGMVADARPDLVDVTSPPETHLDAIRTLSPTVKWIICQKPFCRSVDEARAAIEIAEDHGARVIIHENFRFQPWYRKIKELLERSVIAAPYQVSFRLRPGDGQGPEAYMARQPYFQKMQRFLIHETGVHWIDTFRFLMGEITAVSASLTRLNPMIAGEDAGIVQFEFANGSRGLFDGNRLASHAARNRRLTMGEMEIDGPGGSIRLDGDGQIRVRAHDENVWKNHPYDWTDHLFGGDCVYLTNKAALAAFRSGQAGETEAAAYLRNIEIVDAIYLSHTERRWVNV